MPDSLQPFVFEGAGVRGGIVHLGATWRAVLERRQYPHALREVLGELMAASALLASNLKFTGSMIMQMQGSGPVSILVVECSGDLEMRAMAHWQGDPGGPLPLLLGGGRFVITLDPAEGRRKYQGVVALDGDTVADVLAHYMHSSEQLETRFWLAADGDQACGMLLQRMPHAGTADPEAWSRALALAGTLGRGELLATPAATLVRRLFHEEDVRVFPQRPVSFRCSCSRERVIAMLRMLGQGEVSNVAVEQGKVEVNCEFCNRHYTFDRVDVEQIFAAETLVPPPSSRH
ncbi:MAG TPA: Hsp33 family molecular chaperone HslO [Burkholderiales bacterium]|nr:Hsp33 family molecular chaperone HslO [Burkholderiales bacterium]